MKKIVLYSFFCLFVSAFVACEKDEEKTVLTNTTPGTLSLNKTAFVLTEADAKNVVITFSWTAFVSDVNVAKTYSLEIDKAGNNFKKPIELASASALTKSLTVSALNSMVTQDIKLLPDFAHSLEVRVKCSIVGSAPTYSNVVTFTATPYFQAAKYPVWYVPGSYQGWMPDKAATIASKDNDGKYEGYINFPDATTSFKFTPAPNWTNDYGDEATTGDSGKLKVKGTDIKVNTPGYYLIKADSIANTWSILATTWSVVGTASVDWDTDTNLKYDAATDAWSATLSLKKGEMKFRANKTSVLSYGDTDANGSLEAGGDNIKIDADGTYVVSLLLGKAGNYTYTLKKN